MIKLLPNKEYVFKLIPVDYENSEMFLELNSFIIDDKVLSLHKFFLRVIDGDGKVDTLILGNSEIEFIKKTLHGFYGTPEGYFVTMNAFLGDACLYFANLDKSLISKDVEFDQSLVYTDMVKYKPVNLFDISNGYLISFTTTKELNKLIINKMKVITDKSFYEENSDHTFISELYSNLNPLLDEMKEYRQKLIDAIDSL